MSIEPSALNFPEQVPEPLMPLPFPAPLTIFYLLEKGFVMSLEAEASYVSCNLSPFSIVMISRPQG